MAICQPDYLAMAAVHKSKGRGATQARASSGVGVAHTWRCLGTSVLWSLGTSAVPGAYLLVHRDRAQQVGAREEQVGRGQGRVSDFSVPPRAGATCSIRFEPSHTVGCIPTCPLGSSGGYLAHKTQGAEHKSKYINTHSNVLAWRIPGTGEPGGLPSILGAPKSLQMVIAAMKLKEAYSLEGKL